MFGFKMPIALLATLGAFTIPVPVSDPVGVYVVVDRVVVEPQTGDPARVQVWGVFAVAEGSGSVYRPPQSGYMYYSVTPTNERAARAEWSDLRAAAGTGQTIGFAQRYKPFGRLRGRAEAPAQPDVYPLGFGLVRVPAIGGSR